MRPAKMRPGSSMPTNQIIIKYKTSAIPESAISPASAAQLQRLSDAAGVSLAYVREMSGDAHVLRLPARMPLKDVQAIADRLSALPEVEYAEPDAIMVPMLTPNDPQYTNQWHYFAPGCRSLRHQRAGGLGYHHRVGKHRRGGHRHRHHEPCRIRRAHRAGI